MKPTSVNNSGEDAFKEELVCKLGKIKMDLDKVLYGIQEYSSNYIITSEALPDSTYLFRVQPREKDFFEDVLVPAVHKELLDNYLDKNFDVKRIADVRDRLAIITAALSNRFYCEVDILNNTVKTC